MVIGGFWLVRELFCICHLVCNYSRTRGGMGHVSKGQLSDLSQERGKLRDIFIECVDIDLLSVHLRSVSENSCSFPI